MKIVGIDPGTSTTGVAIIELDDMLNFSKIETVLIDVSNTTSKDFVFTLDLKLMKIDNQLRDVLSKHKPFSVAIERPFINPRRPTAVLPLAKLLGVLVRCIHQFDHMQYREFPPMQVKAAVGRGDSTKDDMLSNLKHIDEIVSLIDLDTISEHEVDAIATIYTERNLLRRNPHLLFHQQALDEQERLENRSQR